MTDINITAMTGRLTDNPDLVGKNGDILKLTVAVNRSVKDGDSWKDEVMYFDWVRYKTSEKFAALFHKGDMVTLKGRAVLSRVESGKYKDKDGNPHKFDCISFVCDSVDGLQRMAPSKPSALTADPEFPDEVKAKPQSSAKGPEEWNDDDDIPF